DTATSHPGAPHQHGAHRPDAFDPKTVTGAEAQFLESELDYYKQRYFLSEQRSGAMAAFAGLVVGFVASSISGEAIARVHWAFVALLAASIVLLLISI